MSVIVLCSVRSGPGVTTTALLTAGCLSRGVLVEADVSGGVLAARFGLERQPGLTTFAAARTTAADGWREHVQTLFGVSVLVGPDDPHVSARLWSQAGEDLASSLRIAAADVVVDAGRLSIGSGLEHLISEASLLLVVTRPEIGDLVTAARWLPHLRSTTTDIAVVLAQHGPFGSVEIASQLGVDVLAEIPTDERTAAALMGLRPSAVALNRTELGRAARSLADAIVHRLDPVSDEPHSTTTIAAAEVPR